MAEGLKSDFNALYGGIENTWHELQYGILFNQ